MNATRPSAATPTSAPTSNRATPGGFRVRTNVRAGVVKLSGIDGESTHKDHKGDLG